MSLTISDLVDQSLPALKQPPELFGGGTPIKIQHQLCYLAIADSSWIFKVSWYWVGSKPMMLHLMWDEHPCTWFFQVNQEWNLLNSPWKCRYFSESDADKAGSRRQSWLKCYVSFFLSRVRLSMDHQNLEHCKARKRYLALMLKSKTELESKRYINLNKCNPALFVTCQILLA
jgi:hypothetical protein